MGQTEYLRMELVTGKENESVKECLEELVVCSNLHAREGISYISQRSELLFFFVSEYFYCAISSASIMAFLY